MQPSAILSILVQAKGIQKTSAELEKLNASAKRSAKGLEGIEKQQKLTAESTSDLNSRFSHLDNTVGDFNRTMTATRNVVGLIKFPALIAGAGMATQAIGALSSGAVGLVGALAPLSGAGLAGAAGMVAVGQAAGVAKLATIGLDKAIKGQKGAMDKLSPVQRAFVKDIRALRGETESLRGQAQRGLLPGLAKALSTVLPMLKLLQPIVGATARAMGGLAVAASRVVKTWGSDLVTVGKTNVGVIKNLGTAAIIAADGARHLVVVAGPLLTWLSKLTVVGAQWARAQIVAGRESGKLAGFLEKTKAVMSTMGAIIANLAVGLFNIGKAAAPLGRDLLGSLEKLTAKFKEWTASASGRNTLDDYFRSAREPIMQIAGLIGDIGAAFLRLSTGTGASSLVVQMRSLVPILENVVANTTAAFGPALITALGNVLRLFAQIAGSSGPLVQMVRLIGLLAGGLADLLQASPVLNSMTVSTIGLYGSMKALSFVFGPLVASVKLLGVAMVGTTAAQNLGTAATLRQKVALVATAAAMYVTQAAAKAFAAAQWLLNAALTANPIGLVIVGLVALGVGLVVAYKKVEAFRNAVNATFSWIKANWPLVLGILTGPIGLAVAVIAKHWSAIRSAFSSGVSAILAILRGSVGAMAGAGKAMGSALINGFKSALNFAHQLASMMRDLISRAPGYALGVGQAIVRGIINGIKSAAGGIGNALKGAVKGVTPGFLGIGDGIGKGAGVLPKAGKGSAALMGANSSLGPIAGIGSSFGLHVSSGRRPGSITSSGNVSYHSSGEAIDEAGPPAGMMAFFKVMKSKYGSRLAELIYGPGKVGIKDGRPYNFGPALNAQHMDHVHVALDTGKPGVGDGTGKRAGRFMGDGYGKTALQSLWTRAGGSKSAANMAAAIALAESGGKSTASHRNTDGSIDRGLWQINSVHGALSTFSPIGNAKAAVKISSGGRNWNPWVTYKTGAYKRFLGGGGPTEGSGSGGRSGATSGKGGAGGAGGAAAPAPSMFEQAQAFTGIYAAQAASTPGTADDVTAITAQRNVVTARIKKIRAALKKNLTPATRVRLQQELAQRIGEHAGYQSDLAGFKPTADDFHNAARAQSMLTPGLEDDLAATQSTYAGALQTYNKAVQGGDPRKITDAATALKSAADDLQSVSDAMQQAAVKNMFDWSDANIALAGLTDTLDDDKVAMQARLGLDQQMLQTAMDNQDPAAIAQYATAVKSDTDAIKQLNEAVTDQTEILKQQNDLLKQQLDEARTAKNVSQTDYATLAQAIASVASGQIGGKVGLGFMSPGFSGGGSRY